MERLFDLIQVKKRGPLPFQKGKDGVFSVDVSDDDTTVYYDMRTFQMINKSQFNRLMEQKNSLVLVVSADENTPSKDEQISLFVYSTNNRGAQKKIEMTTYYEWSNNEGPELYFQDGLVGSTFEIKGKRSKN